MIGRRVHQEVKLFLELEDCQPHRPRRCEVRFQANEQSTRADGIDEPDVVLKRNQSVKDKIAIFEG